jgi:hypothetical protein
VVSEGGETKKGIANGDDGAGGEDARGRVVDEGMSGELLESAICRVVWEKRAVTVSALYEVFGGVNPRRIRRAIQRLERNGRVIVRKKNDSEGWRPRSRYLVLGARGLRFIGVTDAGSAHRYRDAPRAERILYSNRIAERFIETGLPREMLMDRNSALEALGLQSAMTPLDWAIDAPQGVYTVHVKTPNNGKRLWTTIRKCVWLNRVAGHIVVCSDANGVTDERRRYLESPKRPIAKHIHVISFEKPEDVRDVVDNLIKPKAWRNQIAAAFYCHCPADIKYSVPSEDEAGPIACRIQHEKCGAWMAGDLRTWDVALANAAREWDPVSALTTYGTDRLVLLVRDFRDARAKAASLGWREHIWWALANASSGRSLFCVKNENLVVPDLAAGDRSGERRRVG